MNTTNSILVKRARRVLALAGILLLAGGTVAHAQKPHRGASRPDPLVGSWLLQYSVPSFGPATVPILSSFTSDGIVIETDTPTPSAFVSNAGQVVLGNGHGEWKPRGKRTFFYTYFKPIYRVNGPGFGLSRTNVTVTTNPEGTTVQGTVDIRFTDNAGTVVFTAAGTLTGTKLTVQN